MASLSCFVIFWIEYPVLIYVNNKFCNQNLGFDLYRAVLNISEVFTVCTNFIEVVGYEECMKKKIIKRNHVDICSCD